VVAAGLWLTLSAEAADKPRHATRVTTSDDGVVVVGGSDDTTFEAGDKTVRIEHVGHHGLHVSVDDGGSGVVRIFSDASVGPNERIVGDVVAVFGNADVSGEVSGDVVAVLGQVRLHHGATVDGDVVSVGGRLLQEDGTSVNGETVSIGLLPFAWSLPALPILLAIVAMWWLLSAGVGWLFVRLFPVPAARVAVTCARRTALSLVIGILSLPLMFVATVLLFVTVIGIPLAILLPPMYTITSFLGQLIAGSVLGCKLMRRPITESTPLGAPLAAGALFVALFFVAAAAFSVVEATRFTALFFGLLGALFSLALSSIGTGAFLLSRFGSQPVVPATTYYGSPPPSSVTATPAGA